MAKIKNYIRELRDARGWSQEELAGRTGTTNQQIGRLELGQRRLTAEWMYRLADALECHPTDLLDGGPARLKPRTRAIADIFEGLNEDQQDAFFKAASALAQPKRIKKAS